MYKRPARLLPCVSATTLLIAAGWLCAAGPLAAQAENPRFGVWKLKSDAPPPALNIMTYEPYGDGGMQVTVESTNREGRSTRWGYVTLFDGVFRPVEGQEASETAVEVIDERTNRITNRRDGQVTQIIINVLSDDGNTIDNEYRRLNADGSERVTHASYERIGPRAQPGTIMGLYAPAQHPLYDGRFRVSGSRIYQVGTLTDASPWDHMGDDASNLRLVTGRIDLDVDEIRNTGSFRAELQLPEGHYVVELTDFREFSPCQDGGIAAYLFEHGNAGCGDANWPKSLLFVAGWGIGNAWLDGEPLYEDYLVHFMVTQGMRDRQTLKVARAPAGANPGAINPAAMQLDFYIRSPERNDANHPDREVFDHFFAMEVTWR